MTKEKSVPITETVRTGSSIVKDKEGNIISIDGVPVSLTEEVKKEKPNKKEKK